MKMFDAVKTRIIGLSYGEKAMTMLSCFHPIPERNGRTDRQTDRFAILISRVSILTHDKNSAKNLMNVVKMGKYCSQ